MTRQHTAENKRCSAVISTSRTRRSTSKNAKANETHAGFLPEERAYVDKWLGELEFVDVMRNLAGDIQGPYTWWSQRGRAFDNNVGWRIDYQFATPELAETACGFVIDKARPTTCAGPIMRRSALCMTFKPLFIVNRLGIGISHPDSQPILSIGARLFTVATVMK